MEQTFKRGEKLKSKKMIGRLFNREGKSFGRYPLRVVYLETPLNSSFPAQFTISVPKRNFKKAVDRNKIRRQMREAYRLNKHKLYEVLEAKGKQMIIMVLFTAKEAATYQEIETKMIAIIEKLIQEL